MRNLSIVLLCIVAMPVCVEANTDSPVIFGERAEALHQRLNSLVPWGFSGSLLVAVEGEPVLHQAYGMADREAGRQNTIDTVFTTGSLTKQFTAAAIMKLVMDGTVSTQHTLDQYFDAVPEDKQGITLEHLLRHTSGIQDYRASDFEDISAQALVDHVFSQPLQFEPGTEFSYSNAGYSLLAMIIEKVSGKPYEQFLREQLFLPAGMKYTGYRLPDWSDKQLAHMYADSCNGTFLERDVYPTWLHKGNGGIMSTTGDMLLWHKALNGTELLSAEAKKMMFTPGLEEYGYGWDILPTPWGTVIRHDGGTILGSSALMERYIDRDTMFILFCNQRGNGEALIFGIKPEIVEALFEEAREPLPQPDASAWSDLSAYAGTYGTDMKTVTVEARDGSIHASTDDPVLSLALKTNGAVDPVRLLRLQDQAVRGFSALVTDNWEPFRAVLANSDAFDRLKKFIEMRSHEYSRRIGAMQNVRAIDAGMRPLDPGQEALATTSIEIQGEKGSMFFRVYWNADDKLYAFEPLPPNAASGRNETMEYLPVAPDACMAYDIMSGERRDVRFEWDGNDIFLIIGRGDQATRLKRMIR